MSIAADHDARHDEQDGHRHEQFDKCESAFAIRLRRDRSAFAVRRGKHFVAGEVPPRTRECARHRIGPQNGEVFSEVTVARGRNAYAPDVQRTVAVTVICLRFATPPPGAARCSPARPAGGTQP